MHEASLYDTNSFLTLTYSDEHLPKDGSLVKKHHQDFMKRVRKQFPNRRIRYYQCGEYGDENNRPHYHSCLFNLSFNDEQLYSEYHGNTLYTSQTLEDLWGHGFCTIGNLTFESASYVAGYILKKITGARADDHYLRHDEYGVAYWVQPEYSTMSTGNKKGDGLGADWLRTYHEDCYPSDDLPVPGVGVTRGVPRYYDALMEDISPGALADTIRIRRTFAAAHPELFTKEHLNSQYLIYKAKMKERTL